MEALFKAIGALPKWFTWVGLLLVLTLLAVTTYSITRTILFDCGSINVAGTTLGGHCDRTAFISTSIWARKALPDREAEAISTGAASVCEYSVTNSMTVEQKVQPGLGGQQDEQDDLFRTSGIDRDTNLLWYKLPYRDGLYDLIFLCSDDDVLVIVTSNASWPADRFLRQATDRLDTVLAKLRSR